MRCGLVDLLISIAAACVGAFGWLAFVRPERVEGLNFFVILLVGYASYLLITPPIYRWFHLEPLWMPRCPHCRHKDRLYYAPKVQPNWPIGEIICANCENTLELWYDEPKPHPPDRGLIRFKLLWPQSFGRWRQLPAESNET
jgi:hypothetical protein